MRYRLTHAAQADIASILAWSQEQFGLEARERYRALMVAAIRDVATRPDDVGNMPRPELGDGVFSWHLSQSRRRSRGGVVRRPRHFLLCRREGDIVMIGRILHDSMDLPRHSDPQQGWE